MTPEPKTPMFDDVLNERGEFEIEMVRASGAIDFIKKLETKTVIDKDTENREVTHKVGMYSSSEGRKEVANYTSLEKPPSPPVEITRR